MTARVRSLAKEEKEETRVPSPGKEGKAEARVPSPASLAKEERARARVPSPGKEEKAEARVPSPASLAKEEKGVAATTARVEKGAKEKARVQSLAKARAEADLPQVKVTPGAHLSREKGRQDQAVEREAMAKERAAIVVGKEREVLLKEKGKATAAKVVIVEREEKR